MRATLICISLLHLPLYACPDANKAAAEWIQENFNQGEENPLAVQTHVSSINSMVSAVRIRVPADPEEKDAAPRYVTAFFSGGNCEFSQQWNGEIADSMELSGTKFLFIKAEEVDDDQRQILYLVITVKASGEVSATHDQHGTEMQFSQSVQARCEGKVGEMTTWQRDPTDRQLVVVRERQSDRDEKCRVIQDSSSFRYYRLTDEIWRLDDGERDEEVAAATPAKSRP